MRKSSLEQNRNTTMAANSTFMIAEAERRFPVRIRIGVPPDGLGYLCLPIMPSERSTDGDRRAK